MLPIEEEDDGTNLCTSMFERRASNRDFPDEVAMSIMNELLCKSDSNMKSNEVS